MYFYSNLNCLLKSLLVRCIYITIIGGHQVYISIIGGHQVYIIIISGHQVNDTGS